MADGGAPRRKLIEVSLPLEVINRESAREKSIRHGHPSTLHLWWARRPLAAARAVLFAQLVDDPSSHPERFATEEEQRAERARLHGIIERLVVWENIRDERLLAEARAEILASTGGNPPPILDPFAGGGTIPLEAQRLGLEAHASDLNPVAVLINKALIEIPPKFAGRPPVHPDHANAAAGSFTGAQGLAADVRSYGAWMRDRALERIGHLYPTADGRTVIAWIWARTVTCPNPACGIEMPLVRSWWLGKKKGKEAYVVPSVVADPTHPSGKKVEFSIGRDASGPATDGTVGRTGAICVACQTGVDLKYVREEGRAGRMGAQLMATVAEGQRSRIYLPPDEAQVAAARQSVPAAVPQGEIFDWPGRINVFRYGMTRWADLFTNRQLVALTTFSDLVTEAREQVLADGGSPEYADAVAVYLGLCASKMTAFHCSLSRWRPGEDKTAPAFGRQAIAMVWDYAEPMPFAGAGGDWLGVVNGAVKVLQGISPAASGSARQVSAQSAELGGNLISTDPPYYDNIGYSDLSDFFYVWLRRTLKDIVPSLFGTLLVPKAEELVANPYRHHGKEGAKEFFEDGFREVFARARESALPDFPITVYYAFKQSDAGDDGESSSGWETLLEGMIHSGWQITSTWPMRSERSGRMISVGTNALASSIVLSLRPRPASAPTIDRRGFIGALRHELSGALRDLQSGGIAPVDLPQAAIGPGMAVFSRYSAVIESDGAMMTVRAALARINEILDEVLTDTEGDFDATTRFCIGWFRTHGYSDGPYGEAELLGNARGIAVATLARDEVLASSAGIVRLFRPADLPGDYDVIADLHTSCWEALHHLVRILDTEGVTAAGGFLAQATSRSDGAVDPDLVTELAYLLFRVAEDNKWAKDAIGFNHLVTAWPDILDASRSAGSAPAQGTIDFESESE